eukprot:3148333-Karenia_brevis.AAC.1
MPGVFQWELVDFPDVKYLLVIKHARATYRARTNYTLPPCVRWPRPSTRARMTITVPPYDR